MNWLLILGPRRNGCPDLAECLRIGMLAGIGRAGLAENFNP